MNVRALMLTMQEACRHWIGRDAPGAIVNVASANAFQNESPESIYNASKAALVALTKAFAHEMGHHGIPRELRRARGDDHSRDRSRDGRRPGRAGARAHLPRPHPPPARRHAT